MSPIVRGSKLVVVSTPPAAIAQKTPTHDTWGRCSHPKIGDNLWVASRKKNGWVRVKNARTDLVTSLRVGPWVKKVAVWGHMPCEIKTSFNSLTSLASAAASAEPLVVHPPTSSSMDQLIRKSQVDALEAALEAKDKEIADLEKKRSALEYVGRRDAEERAELKEHYQSELGRVRDLLTEQQERNNELLKLVADHVSCRMIDRETINTLNDTNAELKAQLKQLLEGGHEEEGFVLPDELDQ